MTQRDELPGLCAAHDFAQADLDGAGTVRVQVLVRTGRGSALVHTGGRALWIADAALRLERDGHGRDGSVAA